jgi:DnaK suppressor protein
MIDARYEELKRALEVRRDELQRNLGVRLADVRGSNGGDGGRRQPLDPAEASESHLQQDVSVSLTEMTAEVLRRVDEALARLASGVYGVCVECHAEIPTKRLTALPFAVRCRDCQELQDVEARRPRHFSVDRSNSLLRWDAD